jgi:hypothetical protein
MTGGRLMGDAMVTGQFEREIIRVGKYQGRYTRVGLVVTESGLEVGDAVLQFGNGQRWSPGLRHSFADGSRSRAIDLPGHVRDSSGAWNWSAEACRPGCARTSSSGANSL